MPGISDLKPILACPRCDATPLHDGGQDLHCKSCKTRFPKLDGVVCLLADPDSTLGEWRQRYHLALEKLRKDRAQVEQELKECQRNTTTERLERLREGFDARSKELKSLLKPLELTGLSPRYETYLALRTRLPSDQGLSTYYANVHRDWCWGDEENRASANLVIDAIGKSSSAQNLLVLGSGAGRLAYDLHQALDHDSTVALDFNPALALIAKSMAAGDSMESTEFPIAPRSAADVAVTQTLKAPEAARAGFSSLVGDAQRPPFASASIDVVVTPWLIDIIPEDFHHFAERMNHLLVDSGRWVIFGSLAFAKPDKAQCLSLEEVQDVLEDTGFDHQTREATIPYMSSPISRHGRQETVVVITAEKKKAAKAPPRYRALPDWIVTGKEPVPASPSFQEQMISTRIYAFIMSLIDGKRTIEDMASLMEQQKLMPAKDAEIAIRNFLIKMYEDSQRYSNPWQ